MRTFQVQLSDGKTLYERRFNEPFKGPIIPLGSLVEHHPISPIDQSRIHEFGKQVLLGLFLDYVLYAGRIWKGDILVADLEELDEMDASDIHAKRLNAKRGGKAWKWWRIHVPSRGWNSKTFWWRSGTEHIHFDTEPTNSWDCHHDFLWESEGSPFAQHFQDSFPDAAEARNDFWSMSGGFKWRHHVEPRVKLYSPREASFPTPLNYNWLHEGHSHDLGCIAGKPHRWFLEHRWVKKFVWFMDRFHTVYLIEGKASGQIHVVRGEISQTTSSIKAWSFVARNLQKSVKKLKNEGEAKLGKWKTKARKTPEDFEGSISLTRRITNSKIPSRMLIINWKHQLLLLCLAKLWRRIVGVVPPTKLKQDLRVFWKLVNLQDCVWEGSLPIHHEDHVAGKGSHCLQHHNLEHKFIPLLQAMKILEAKGAADKEWETFEKKSA